MGHKSNLKGQFIYAINSSFNNGLGGIDKHSIKKDTNLTAEDKMVHVYSFKEAKSLRDVACQVANYCKNTYNIKEVKNIESKHINSFLDFKIKEGKCNVQTIKNYISRIRKIQCICNNTFSTCKLDWKDNIKVDLINEDIKLRNVHMKEEDYFRIIKYKENSTSQGVIAIKCIYIFGVRNDEISLGFKGTDINLENNTLHVRGKNGKDRYIKLITEEQINFAKELKEQFKDNKIVTIKPESVNRFLNRTFKELNLKEYLSAKTNTHSIRKLFAEKMFKYLKDYYYKSGHSLENAKIISIQDISEMLGHSRIRGLNKELIKTYVPSFYT